MIPHKSNKGQYATTYHARIPRASFLPRTCQAYPVFALPRAVKTSVCTAIFFFPIFLVAKMTQEKLDDIQDGFINYQLLATRLQYLNSHILLGNRCVLQQQHVDCKIADALLKKRLNNTQMVGTLLARPGPTWSSICHMLRAVLV